MEFTFFFCIFSKFKFHFALYAVTYNILSFVQNFQPFPLPHFFFRYNYNHLFPCYSLFGKGSQFKDLKKKLNLLQLVKMDISTLHNFFKKKIHFWNTSILCIYKSLKCAPLNNNLMWMYKFSHKNIRCAKKWNGGCAFKSVLNSQNDFHSWTISTSQINEKSK